MRLLLFALLSRAAGEITWHVGSTGQSCDVTCTSLNPSKSCALDSFASAVGSSNFNNIVTQVVGGHTCASTSSTSNHLGPFFDATTIACSYYDGSGAGGNCINDDGNGGGLPANARRICPCGDASTVTWKLGGDNENCDTVCSVDEFCDQSAFNTIVDQAEFDQKVEQPTSYTCASYNYASGTTHAPYATMAAPREMPARRRRSTP